MQSFLNGIEQKWVLDTYQKMEEKLEAECKRLGKKIPFIAEHDTYKDQGEVFINWWTNGFWGGLMWQMYHATGKECYKESAVNVENRLDEAMFHYEYLDHDVGFLWMHTAAANYGFTGNEESLRRGRHAAGILAGRYNPNGKYLRAWNSKDKKGWMIIDCMMNLSILYWAGKIDEDPRYEAIAKAHADTTMEKLMRPDGSCNHIAALDPLTGELLDTPAGQGYASGSSWSRGQAWAIYGFAISYAHTKEQKYLDEAKKAAHYFMANAALSDYLPLCDFRAPKEPVYYDATAGACASCGMLEIAKYVPEFEKLLYEKAAVKILRAMEHHFADWNIETDGILDMGKGMYHENTQPPQQKIIYGDYFFVEAILRLLEKDYWIW